MSIEISLLPRQTLAGMSSGDLFPTTAVLSGITKSVTLANLSLYITSQITGGYYQFPTSSGTIDQVLAVDSAGQILWSGASHPVVNGTNPPTNTSSLWYDINSGRLYVYYGNNWVDASPAARDGYMGSVGYTGSRGSQGIAGPQGEIGYTGSIGNQGPPGVGGQIGPIGYTGSAGNDGYTGSAGTSGMPTGLSDTVQFNDNNEFGATTMSFNKNSGQFMVAASIVGTLFDLDGTINATGYKLNNNPFTAVSVVAVPSTANSSGTIGEISYDSTYLYVCVDTDSWVRVNLASVW